MWSVTVDGEFFDEQLELRKLQPGEVWGACVFEEWVDVLQWVIGGKEQLVAVRLLVGCSLWQCTLAPDALRCRRSSRRKA